MEGMNRLVAYSIQQVRPKNPSEAMKLAEHIHGLVQTAYSYPLSWHQGAFTDSLQNKWHYHFVLVDTATDEWLGYAQLQLLFEEAELLNLAIDAGHRGKGLGRQLLAAALTELQMLGMRQCLLEVREPNQSARHLYEALGFRQIARRENYYQKEQEDAIIYLWKKE